MSFLRKLFFYLFAAVYLMVCPTLIWHALGYKYQPKELDQVIRTGLIRLSTLPSGADIYFGNKKSSQKTPATITNLPAGDYQTRLKLKGYRTWKATITVRNGRAAVFDHILLLPNQLTEIPLLDQSFVDFRPIDQTEWLWLYQGKRLSQWQAFNLNSKELQSPFANSAFAEAEVKKLYLVAGSDFCLFSIQRGKETEFLGVTLKSPFPKIENLTTLFMKRSVDQVEWDSGRPHDLYVVHDGLLSRLNINEKTVYPSLAEHVKGITIEGGEVFALTDKDFVEIKSDGKQISRYGGSVPFQQLFDNQGMHRISFLESSLVVFLSEKGRLITNHLPYELLEEDVEGWSYDSAGKSLLAWSEDQLQFFLFKRQPENLSLFEQGPERVKLPIAFNSILAAQWVYEDAYVLFQSNDAVFLSERATPKKEPVLIAKTKKKSRFYYQKNSDSLYYLNEEGKLMMLQLFPESAFDVLEFPKKEHQMEILSE